MGYLDKAKKVVSTLEGEHSTLQGAKEANKAKEASSTAQTTTTTLRNKSLKPEVAVAALPVITLPEQPDTLPRLPWQLERLLAAAASDVLPQGMTYLESGLVFDLQKYVLAGAGAYLIGDRDEALKRLWQAHRAWQGEGAN